MVKRIVLFLYGSDRARADPAIERRSLRPHLHLSQVRSSLRPVGQEISDALSVPAIVNAHWEAISREMAVKNPQNPYDIQGVALAIARNCFDKIFTEEERNKAKTLAFIKGMNLLEIFPVIGIEIRNRVMK
jgi:hypothetical protein